MPGRGKSFEAFQSDQMGCKNFAAGQVSGQADSANQRAVGAALLSTVLTAGLGSAIGGIGGDAGAGAAVGAAVGAGGGSLYGAANGAGQQANIQQQYDAAFAQCMFARGNQVPGFAPNVAAAAPDPLVRSTQGELIRLGYLHSSADGYIGEKTRTAIAAYQQGAGLPADGAPSPQLLAKLQSTAAGGSTATASSSTDWVAPAATRAATPVSATSAGWVAPANGTPAVTPAAATSGGWVAPSKTE
jgi:hypothetical protein